MNEAALAFLVARHVPVIYITELFRFVDTLSLMGAERRQEAARSFQRISHVRLVRLCQVAQGSPTDDSQIGTRYGKRSNQFCKRALQSGLSQLDIEFRQ